MNIREYQHRRKRLIQQVNNGIILLAANNSQARNYKGNPYPFRQDSSFLYFTGISRSDLIYILDAGSGMEYLTGYDPTMEDAIWSGPQKKLKALAEIAGIEGTMEKKVFEEYLRNSRKGGKQIHYLPPYTCERAALLAQWVGASPDNISQGASLELIQAVVDQRSVKSDEEVAEIEKALDEVTGPMHIMAMKMAQPGRYEHEIVAEMQKLAKMKDMEFAYQIICSVHGEILHNETHQNKLEEGQLLLVDAGVESRNHYASDITRTCPVGGRFNTRQKDIYSIVLEAQGKAIDAIKPGIAFRDIHFMAARTITNGLKELGIMKGDTEEAVAAGAHALFFPHGLGHMLGLDVHDMEDLGEDHVGYSGDIRRSRQFGTAYLRLARKLAPGFVLTVEPGIYFIPELIARWKADNQHETFINYSVLENYLGFGGVRIEDNVLVTRSGSRILGTPIPKNAADIEKMF